MTVQTTSSRIQYSGNGATVAFSFPYVFFAATDLLVTLFDNTAAANVAPAPVLNGGGQYDYTVSGVQDSASGEFLAGATVLFNHAPLGNHVVTIKRVIPATQNVALVDNAKFPAATVNSEFDRLTMLAQQNTDSLAHAVLTPDSDAPGSQVLPPAASRAGLYLGFDGAGNVIAKTGPSVTTAVLKTPLTVNANNTVVDTGVNDFASVNNQTGASLTLLLKAAPADGDELTVKDAGRNCTLALPIIVSGNGKPIDFDNTLQLTYPGQAVKVKYRSSTTSWYVI